MSAICSRSPSIITSASGGGCEAAGNESGVPKAGGTASLPAAPGAGGASGSAGAVGRGIPSGCWLTDACLTITGCWASAVLESNVSQPLATQTAITVTVTAWQNL